SPVLWRAEDRPLGSSNLVRRRAKRSGPRAESLRRAQSPSVGSRRRLGERRPRVTPRKSRPGFVLAYGIRHRTERAGRRLSTRTQKRNRRASGHVEQQISRLVSKTAYMEDARQVVGVLDEWTATKVAEPVSSFPQLPLASF